MCDSLNPMGSNAGKVVQKYQGMMAWPTVLLATVILLLFATTCTLSVSGLMPPGLGFFLNIFLLYALFTPLHEACHRNIVGKNYRRIWVNDLVGFVSGVVLLFDYRALRRLHLTHHRNTNDNVLDPDHWVKVKNPFILLFRCFTIVPYYFWYFFLHVTMKPKTSGNISLSLYVIVMYTILYSLIFLIGTAGYWTEVLMLWVGPHLFASALIIFLFAYIPHKSCNTNDRYHNTRIHSIDGKTGWFSNIVYLYQNYHLIHHLFPRIPFYLYPMAFGKLRFLLLQKGSKIETASETQAT